MITAMQSSRIKAANHLMATRESLAEALNCDCFKHNSKEVEEILTMRAMVDEIIRKLVPNEAVK